jgi:hypothetical protein
VTACGAGLFDAALNFLWNETIRNLREKVARFDLEYFLDSLVTDPKRRNGIRTADDLGKLEDWELIRGCLDAGLITEIGFKHLDYIRDMRNYASAAHPNQVQLTGFQLIAWPANSDLDGRRMGARFRSRERAEPAADDLDDALAAHGTWSRWDRSSVGPRGSLVDGHSVDFRVELNRLPLPVTYCATVLITKQVRGLPLPSS